MIKITKKLLTEIVHKVYGNDYCTEFFINGLAKKIYKEYAGGVIPIKKIRLDISGDHLFSMFDESKVSFSGCNNPPIDESHLLCYGSCPICSEIMELAGCFEDRFFTYYDLKNNLSSDDEKNDGIYWLCYYCYGKISSN